MRVQVKVWLHRDATPGASPVHILGTKDSVSAAFGHKKDYLTIRFSSIFQLFLQPCDLDNKEKDF